MNGKFMTVLLMEAFLASIVFGDIVKVSLTTPPVRVAEKPHGIRPSTQGTRPSTHGIRPSTQGTRPSTLPPPTPSPTGTVTPRPWSPDPSLLLGEYEEIPVTRETNAYFVTDNNTVVTVQVGSTASLRCQVHGVAEHETVFWLRRRDHHLITVGSQTYSNDGRFQVFHNEKVKDWTLRLRFAQPHDAGVYECQVSTHPPIAVLTTLRVIKAAAEIDGGPERHVQVGSSVQLTCSLKDYLDPPTYVFWYHADRMINYDSNTRISVTSQNGASELRITAITKDDSGNYTCQPANAMPASVSIHVITGETPAAMQRASATEVQHRVSLALLSVLVALLAL